MSLEVQLREVFVEEGKEVLADFEQALLLLESLPDDAELIARLFRAAHTVKGNARMLGLARTESFAHELESMLATVRSTDRMITRELTDKLLHALDVLKLLVGEQAGGPRCEEDTFARVVASLKESEPSSPPALPAVQVTLPQDMNGPSRAPVQTTPLRAPGTKMQQIANTQSPALSQYVTFTLGQVDYGIEILSVQEFKGYGAVTPVPNMPSFVRGVMNLRGIIIPVIDLRVRFGLPAPLDELSVIVVVVVGGRTMGLVIDVLSDVIDIPSSDIQQTPELSARVPTAFVKGLAKTGERLVILLDLQHLVSLDEMAA